MERPARLDIVLLLAALTLAGCGGDDPDGGGAEASLDQLRGLPYLGSSRVAPGERSGVVMRAAARSQSGLTLYTTEQLSRADLINEKGKLVHSWRYEGVGVWQRSIPLADGSLVVVGADRPAEPVTGTPDDTRYLMRVDRDGQVVWKRRMRVHHDVEQLPDGRLLALSFARRRDARIHPEIDTRDDRLSFLDAEGRVLEQVSLLDAFLARPDVITLLGVRPNQLGGEPWIDLFHANSVEWIERPELEGSDPLFAPGGAFQRGNVLVCFRHQNCIAVVDPRRGEVVWAWGRGELLGPHDAQVLPDGNLLVFDNGMTRGWSRVLELDPRTGVIVWRYRAEPPTAFYTLSKGSNQRLANGNTLIASSDNGRAFEVTPSGEVVWDFRCPHEPEPGLRAAIVRAVRFDRAELPWLDEPAAGAR